MGSVSNHHAFDESSFNPDDPNAPFSHHAMEALLAQLRTEGWLPEDEPLKQNPANPQNPITSLQQSSQSLQAWAGLSSANETKPTSKELNPKTTRQHPWLKQAQTQWGQLQQVFKNWAPPALNTEKPLMPKTESPRPTPPHPVDLLIDQQQWFAALYELKGLQRIEPDEPYHASQMGYVLYQLGDGEGALKQYQQAFELGQHLGSLWLAAMSRTLGSLQYQVKNNYNKAVAYYKKALDYLPNHPDTLAQLADLHYEQGAYTEAVTLYRKMIAQQPDNGELYNFMGYLLWQLDRNAEALMAYHKALALSPENAIAHNNLGVIYLDAEAEPQQALNCFKQALAIDPNYAMAHFNCGRVYQQTQKTPEALQAYRLASRLNAINEELPDEEIQRRLLELYEV